MDNYTIKRVFERHYDPQAGMGIEAGRGKFDGNPKKEFNKGFNPDRSSEIGIEVVDADRREAAGYYG